MRVRESKEREAILIYLIFPVISRLFFRSDFFRLVLLIFAIIPFYCRIFYTQVISAHVAALIWVGLVFCENLNVKISTVH